MIVGPESQEDQKVVCGAQLNPKADGLYTHFSSQSDEVFATDGHMNTLYDLGKNIQEAAYFSTKGTTYDSSPIAPCV